MDGIWLRGTVGVVGALWPVGASARDIQATVPAIAAAALSTLPAKTPVEIEIVDPLDSKTSKPGQRFAIRLAQPVTIEGGITLPAGMWGQGEVVHAAKARGGGKGGELIVNARFLQCGDVRIPLGYLHLDRAGANNVGAALAVSLAVPLAGFLVGGGNIVIPTGTRASAKITAATTVDHPIVPPCERIEDSSTGRTTR